MNAYPFVYFDFAVLREIREWERWTHRSFPAGSVIVVLASPFHGLPHPSLSQRPAYVRYGDRDLPVILRYLDVTLCSTEGKGDEVEEILSGTPDEPDPEQVKQDNAEEAERCLCSTTDGRIAELRIGLAARLGREGTIICASKLHVAQHGTRGLRFTHRTLGGVVIANGNQKLGVTAGHHMAKPGFSAYSPCLNMGTRNLTGVVLRNAWTENPPLDIAFLRLREHDGETWSSLHVTTRLPVGN